MHYVYCLYSKSADELYEGATESLKERIKEHNAGRVQSTKRGAPWELVHYQGFINKTDALREEKFLKSGKGRERLNKLLENTLEQFRD